MKKNRIIKPCGQVSKSASQATAAPSAKKSFTPPCEYRVSESELAKVRKQAESLLTGCSPDVLRLVNRYLDLDTGPDAAFIDAWRKCGRNDLGRNMRINLSATARQTMTPLGLACLVAYAQNFIDEAEARLLRAQKKQR